MLKNNGMLIEAIPKFNKILYLKNAISTIEV